MPAINLETRNFIQSNWDTMDNQQLANALNIPLYQVWNYARRMKLRRTDPKPVYTDEQRKEARKEALQRYREKQAAQGIKPKQYYKPKTEMDKPKRKSPTKANLVANNAPTEKVAKLSTSENPAKFKIRDPYDPKKEYRYERRIDPNNGRDMLVERRVQ